MYVIALVLTTACSDYGFGKTTDASPPSEGDGHARDGASPTDTASDSDSGGPPTRETDTSDSARGDTGRVPPGDSTTDTTGGGDTAPIPTEHEVRVRASADDALMLYVDGVLAIRGDDWSKAFEGDLTLTSGRHVVAVSAWDVYLSISGLIAAVEVDGAPVLLTGSADWSSTASTPPSGWEAVAFVPDSSWRAPTPCGADASFGTRPEELTELGAQWVWSQDCLALGAGWFRAEFDVP